MKPIIHYYDSYSPSNTSSPSTRTFEDQAESVSSRFHNQSSGDSSIYNDRYASTSTYQSTKSSATDVESEYEAEPYNSYTDPSYLREPAEERAVPATPSEFAELFPTTNRLMIKHDESTYDGDRNLRVAHAKRRFEKSSQLRPALTKALTTSFRGKSDLPWGPVQRQDSGYHSEGEEETEVQDVKAPKHTNSMSLEFSNYAHVELTRRNATAVKKYDFEYWGTSYTWRRTVGANDFTSYSLTNNKSGKTVATLTPDPDGQANDGFIRPYSLYFKDSKEDPVTDSRCDVFDVLVSTALMTLIDDTIKRRYHIKRTVSISLAPGSKTLQMEYVGPRRFMNEMFGNRINNADGRRPSLVRSLSTSMKLKNRDFTR
ncbi:hypothetical protein EX30DRAFT_329930 [Ascodesmis nigricans]|uniref:Uncharacterized protein n=1 Tax=Ascodesmis nigricans TaxID=341454 RepID=A0A4S2N0F7_9PEZI|nr:hypothetical protein EX30DRAFT_329930 [Ascodesmis nigricans]